MSQRPCAADVITAAERLRNHIHNTPVFTSRSLDALVGCKVFFKCENLQRTGSFKARGALNTLLQLQPRETRKGVTTHSSGNHGAALAMAARELGITAIVVVPENAPAIKREAIAAYGARIVECGPTLAERETTLADVIAETGAVFIAPYNDSRVIAGQGTAAIEFIESQGDIEQIWVPVGGGGLASGCVLAVEGKDIRVVAVEPELADDAYRSLSSGKLQNAMPPCTVADGLRTALGSLNFEILKDYGLTIHRVSEEEIIAAQQLLIQRLKLVVQLSSAVVFAGLLRLSLEQGVDAGRIGIILTGGNAQISSERN